MPFPITIPARNTLHLTSSLNVIARIQKTGFTYSVGLAKYTADGGFAIMSKGNLNVYAVDVCLVIVRLRCRNIEKFGNGRMSIPMRFWLISRGRADRPATVNKEGVQWA